MPADAPTVAVPTERDNAQEHFARLREWITLRCMTGHPVRDSAYRMALSTIMHRLMKYGPDATLNHLRAREVMGLLLYANGPMAEYLMRIAYFRAIVEGDHAVYEQLNTTLFIPECRAWYWKLCEALMARAPDPEEVTQWVEAMQGEERGVAHLIIGRCYPDLAHPAWLDGLETTTAPGARLAAELVAILAQKPEYRGVIERFLRENPHVRYAS